jgi:TRAP-type C4-dicarboxylate transport system permease large subunit
MILLSMLLALFALVIFGVPIAVALGLVGVMAMLWTQGPDILPNLALVMYDGSTKFPLIAIPLFILAGAIMNSTGISRRLIAFASAILGFVRGGLAMVNVGASMFFAEISGSAVADVAALGSILIPSMKKKGYPGPFAAAITSSSASIAIIIPPSILAVRYDYPVEEVFRLKRVAHTLKEAAWAFLLPFIILGGIFGGFVTATEGAGLAVVAALFIGGVIYRELDWNHLKTAVIDGAVQTAVVMLLVAASALVGVYLTEAQVPQDLARAISEFTNNRYAVLAILNVFFLAIGMFLHSAAAIILVVPIVIPLVNQVGIDPVHFGIIVTLNLAIGQQTPPVASVLVTACSVAKADIWDVTKVNVYFIALLLVLLILVTYVPVIPMGLVEYFYR